ncbi:MAG: ketopantoate reductase C-terminal domain-containing protein [Candidatus Paceibacterota bacterium]
MKKTIYIIGVGGRTGVMFARELRDVAEIVGVGMGREIDAIGRQEIEVKRGAGGSEKFSVSAILPENFNANLKNYYPDFIWMAVRNPVSEAVEFYYRNFKGKEKLPALVFSQNGLSVVGDAKAGLVRALGQEAGKVRIIRVSLINGVDMATNDGIATIAYKIPIKLGFGAADGQSVADLKEIFNAGKFKCQEFQGKDVLKMENSKLFTNLIGMAAAADGLSVSAGLLDKKVFAKEAAMLKEFILAARASGSGFVDNLAGYPINFLAQLFLLPAEWLAPFRGIFERIVAKGRNRPKDLSEIDYYNGEVVKLGKRFGVATPVNEGIVAKAKKLNSK